MLRKPSNFLVEAPSTRASKPGHRHCTSCQSILTPKDADRLRASYAILDNVMIRILDPNVEVELDDKTRKVCVYEKMFKGGV